MSAVNYSERPDERMPLNETAVIIKEEDGFGIIIEINSGILPIQIQIRVLTQM